MTTAHYEGGCQCGAVRYEVDADLDNTIVCNCSRCQRLGFILTFASPSDFTLKSGADSLSSYRFARHMIDHLFCKTCGVQSFARGKRPDGKELVAINARCLDGVEPASLSPKAVDGRSF